MACHGNLGILETSNSRDGVRLDFAEIHPLMNPLILDNLIDKLDLETLKAVRSTCSVWKDCASRTLQVRSKVKISWNSAIEKPSVPTLPIFMKYVEEVTSDMIFFRNYVLEDWNLHSKETEMTEFWIKCGKHIRQLTLTGFYFNFLERSYIRDVLLNWTPNMQSILIEEVNFLDVSDYSTLDELESRKKMKRVTYYSSDGSGESTDETDSEQEEDDDWGESHMVKLDIEDVVQPNFQLTSFIFLPSSDHPTLPLRWKEIFNAYPNLTTLSIRRVGPNDVDNLMELLQELIEIKTEFPNKLQGLRELDIFSRTGDDEDFTMKDEHYKLALQLPLKLQTLSLEVDDASSLSAPVVGSYIKKHGSTVSHLELRTHKNPFPIFPPLGDVIFSALTNLCLNLSSVSTNNLEFLKLTPNLENFTFEHEDEEDTGHPVEVAKQLFSNTIELEPLKSLVSLHVVVNILTPDCPRKISKWFPNLRQFSAVLNDELLHSVYQNMQNIQELNVHVSSLSDYCITGQVDPSTSPQPTLEPPSKRQKMDAVNTIGHSLGIRQMKDLRELSISKVYSNDELMGWNNEIDLTDKSIHEGFIYLTELRSLILPKTKVNGNIILCDQITKNGLIDLCQHVGITALNHCYIPITWNSSMEKLEIIAKNDPLPRHYCDSDCVTGLLLKEQEIENSRK